MGIYVTGLSTEKKVQQEWQVYLCRRILCLRTAPMGYSQLQLQCCGVYSYTYNSSTHTKLYQPVCYNNYTVYLHTSIGMCTVVSILCLSMCFTYSCI